MDVVFGDARYPFRPWHPQDGRVFTGRYALDCETTRIDEQRDWLTPAYVLGAAFDGVQGFFLARNRVQEFLAAHDGVPVVMHNASFDLAVLHLVAPQTDVYRWVDEDHVWDTQLLHRLLVLGTQGHTASGRGESTLERCAEEYLGGCLAKDAVDSRGEPVRLSYGRWLNKDPKEIEPVYLAYLAQDVVATYLLCEELLRRLQRLLDGSSRVWGYASPEWLAEQVRRWGPQTHHIQLRASIVLRVITANGLHLDTARRTGLVQSLQVTLEQRRRALQRDGYLPGEKGCGKALQAILQGLEREHPEMGFPRTETGLYTTSHEALQELAHVVPFVQRLLEFREIEKLLHSFLDKMNRPVLHPSFQVLARTGRTTSFGQVNAQNLPTDDAVRSCFVPSPGHVFIDADYRTIELATLAQACVGQFGLKSEMGRAINEGKDLHTMVAARVTTKGEQDVTKEERKSAKPINFGKPGGMSDRTLQAYAKASYGVHLTDEQVAALSSAWFALFPEMRTFLADQSDTGLEVAKLFKLTPASHHEHTGDGRFLRHRDNQGREHLPHPILGGMCLKTLKATEPQTGDGRPYRTSDVDYFWARVGERLDRLPPKLYQAVRDRQPSVQLQRAVLGLVGRAGVFTYTGRLRAQATYCARHNTVFQGLASDGAKLALWLLWRHGFRIVNFIQDQVLVEVPADSDLLAHALKVRDLMIEGMKSVVPDVTVDVSFAASARWHKDAEAVLDEGKTRLLLWQPPTQEKHTGTPKKASGPRPKKAVGR